MASCVFFIFFFILAFISRSWSDLGQAIGASTSRNTTISDPEKGQFNPTIKKKKNTHKYTPSLLPRKLSVCFVRPHLDRLWDLLFGYKTVPIKTQKNSSPDVRESTENNRSCVSLKIICSWFFFFNNYFVFYRTQMKRSAADELINR